DRFRAQRDPAAAIAAYLAHVQAEATRRGYAFDPRKIGARRQRASIAVTRGQLDHEWQHLRAKLAVRDRERLAQIDAIRRPRAHPCFRVIAGTIEPWERA
ncbi:MAG: pyrimidine dimer DNA glycosylase, partial [Proteobacteria bacterium]|nr:pyrimidine dimer DNA glycosylase [Pseudomonadota bacterium]